MSIQRSSRNAGVKELLESSTARDVADTALMFARSEPADSGFVSKLVGTLHHYHSVFDVLSQADFSYLTLIWGGMKLILIVRFPLWRLYRGQENAILLIDVDHRTLDGQEPQ